MAAIVDENIYNRVVFLESLPERPISLVTDIDFGVFVLVDLGVRLYVHSVHGAIIPEVVPPHPKATATVYTDLKDMYVTTDELAEVAMIDIKVVVPFPDARPFTIGIEIRPEGVGGCTELKMRTRIILLRSD
jgi:hypothetical protein